MVLCSSPVAIYWTPSDPWDSSFGVVSFCPFIQFMRFSRQVYWGGLPFLPPVDYVSITLSVFLYFGLCSVFIAAWAFLYLQRQGLLSSCGAAASHCSGFSCCGAQALGRPGFSSCGCQALQHWLRSYGAWAQLLRSMWDLPRY